jgi:hypothetical protein
MRAEHAGFGRTRATHAILGITWLAAFLAAPPSSAVEPGVKPHWLTDLRLVRTADTQTAGVLTLTVGGEYYESLDIPSEFGYEDVARYTSVILDVCYGVTPWLELSAGLPLRRAAWDGGVGGSGDVTGLDSPEIGIKAAVPLPADRLSVAAWGRVYIPTGDELTAAYGAGDGLRLTGGSGVDLETALLVTFDLTDMFPLRLHANAGWALNGNELGRRFYPHYYPATVTGSSAADNDALILRGAAEFPGRTVDLFTEFRGDLIRDGSLVAAKENPLTVSPGVRVRLPGGWCLTGSASVSISGDDAKTPDFDPHEAYPDLSGSVSLTYGWPVLAADSDNDGVPDFNDQCPLHAEDLDGFQDEDGCPDPDNDEDGVPDSLDGRPLLMEDYDGFEDEDGVPDLDNDRDGIVDERDMCPDDPEDLDGFEDDDGCPDD